MKSLDPVMCADRGPLLMCPLHARVGGGQNQPRNRNPLMQCCSLDTAEVRSMKPQQHRHCSLEAAGVRSLQESGSSVRHSQLMLRNIKIPSSYYTSTDPRTLPSHVIRSLVSQEVRSGGQQRRLVSLSRSSSSVSVQRAKTVKLRTSAVSRSQSFSDQGVSPVYSNVTRRRYLNRDSAQERPRMQQSVSRKYFREPEERSLTPSESLLSKLSATLSSNILPWEYKLAGIGSCWRGGCKL